MGGKVVSGVSEKWLRSSVVERMAFNLVVAGSIPVAVIPVSSPIQKASVAELDQGARLLSERLRVRIPSEVNVLSFKV